MSDVECKFIYGCVLLIETDNDDAEDAAPVWQCVSRSRLQTRRQWRKFGEDRNLRREERKTDDSLGKRKQQKKALRFNGPRNRGKGDKAGKRQTCDAMRRQCVKNTN